ncbi:hypothetical protein H072_6669 [Dactylellina haptotyla CBS 200.50]|uniref:Uncharacterized protein n=1 Tax=Dactylellina haptotyla (strain CBS 200.50) TaxID=1284197 RepID=S8BJU8_DACHA|nr:hypothetical protein H072_6669 [Dactylellina haptotyla CBS 200.50]
MKFFSLCTAAIVPLTLVNAALLPRQTNPKFRATQYSINGTTISGEIETPEGPDSVQIFWAAGDKWNPTPIEARRGWFSKGMHIVYWSFQAEAPGATQFYAKAHERDGDIFAPGNFVNYQL